MPPPTTPAPVVLDTQVVLDLLLFGDASTDALRTALDAGRLQWIATAAMREELARVLAYPRIAAWAARHGRVAEAVLAGFDARARRVDAAPPAAPRCADPDDQVFIDLAIAHRALLLSKDRHVLIMRASLAFFSVEVVKQLNTDGPAGGQSARG
ncbi:putative toxin-antitoxin system toxin component, PIN family [Pseudorhodoferax sp.]|uniref:PIN domain-containing protein n=1 Tax=Pseudorhodoferax sp. TaxID=1993553 RepID=UPI0039E4242F